MVETNIENLIAPVINSLDIQLWGCQFITGKHRSTLRIFIDKPNGITIDDCTQVSREVSACLDVNDPIQSEYCLEVSSPGTPRPLFKPWHFNTVIGKTVKLKLHQPIDQQKNIKAVIVETNDSGIIIELTDKQLTIPFSLIAKASSETERGE